jgi:hypothetical protein
VGDELKLTVLDERQVGSAYLLFRFFAGAAESCH